jgi:hypothetical protein
MGWGKKGHALEFVMAFSCGEESSCGGPKGVVSP